MFYFCFILLQSVFLPDVELAGTKGTFLFLLQIILMTISFSHLCWVFAAYEKVWFDNLNVISHLMVVIQKFTFSDNAPFCGFSKKQERLPSNKLGPYYSLWGQPRYNFILLYCFTHFYFISFYVILFLFYFISFSFYFILFHYFSFFFLYHFIFLLLFYFTLTCIIFFSFLFISY